MKLKPILNITDFLSDIPPKNDIIIRADLNAAISTRSLSEDHHAEDPINTLIGPHENPRRNDSGNLMRDMMRDLDLRSASLFFNCNGKHDTWIYPISKKNINQITSSFRGDT